ncbi:MAG: hypothetical protein GY810_06540 [Aureispira sp.]|nr:hypothetical protein [Aureispira sp.]
MKYLVLVLALVGLFSCKDKPCKDEGTGTLCFCNEMDSTRINVHIGSSILLAVEPLETLCTEALPEGEYESYIQYVRLNTAMGKNIYLYPKVVTCEEVTVRVREGS